jgi:hypothetical protein
MSFKSPEQVLRTALVNNSTVTGFIGNRIFPVVAQASTSLPFVLYRRTGIVRQQTLVGPMGVPRVTADFVVYATTYEQARQVADAMRAVLDGYAGIAHNTQVRLTALENEVDDFVTLAGADLPPVYSVTQSYDIAWQEI